MNRIGVSDRQMNTESRAESSEPHESDNLQPTLGLAAPWRKMKNRIIPVEKRPRRIPARSRAIAGTVTWEKGSQGRPESCACK